MGCLALIAGLAPGIAHAEMSGDEYRSGKSLGDPVERARTAAELEAARQRAAEAEAQRVAAERARQERDALILQRRPLGERLLDYRCTGCHTLAVTDGLARGLVGWRLTVERMRWWHGAPLGAGEAGAIAAHLRTTRPASTLWEWLEAILAVAGVILSVNLPFAWRKLRHRHGASR